jgi:hypothetical protein
MVTKNGGTERMGTFFEQRVVTSLSSLPSGAAFVL